MILHLTAAAACALAAGACLAAKPGEPLEPSAGELAYARCTSCHSLQPGENLPSGPTLHGIVGRPVAGEPGFRYSPALERFAQRHPRWTPELLDAFMSDPEGLVPGTDMAFDGVPDPAERAALIKWLQSR